MVLFFALPLTKRLSGKALYFEIFRLGVLEEFIRNEHSHHVFTILCGATADLRFAEEFAKYYLLQRFFETPGFPGFHDLYLVFEGYDQFPKRETVGSRKRFFATFTDGKRKIFLNLTAGRHESLEFVHFLGCVRFVPFYISVPIGKHRSQNFQRLWSDISAAFIFFVDIKVMNFSSTSSADKAAKCCDI